MPIYEIHQFKIIKLQKRSSTEVKKLKGKHKINLFL